MSDLIDSITPSEKGWYQPKLVSNLCIMRVINRKLLLLFFSSFMSILFN